MQRIIHHRELVDAPCLLPFFAAHPNDWQTAKDNAKKDAMSNSSVEGDEKVDPDSIKIDAHAAMVSPAQERKKGVLGKWLAAKRDQWALQKRNLILEETPAETKKFADILTYAEHLEVCTRILSEDYQEMMRASSKLAEKYQSMGAAFTQMWGEHELSSTSSSHLYQTIGQTWAKLSKMIELRIATGKRHFATPVDDLIMDIIALKEALAKRKAEVYKYTKQMQVGRALQDQMDKIRQSADFTGQQDKYYQLEKDIRLSDMKLEEIQKHCEMVSSRLTRDVERFRVEWHERMRQVIEDFHKQQIEFLQTQSMGLSSALPALSTLDSERADLPSGLPAPSVKTEINMLVSSEGVTPSFVTVPVDKTRSYSETAPPAAAPPLPPPLSPTVPAPPLSPNRSNSFESLNDAKSLDSIRLDNPSEDELGAMGGEISLTEKSAAILTSL